MRRIRGLSVVVIVFAFVLLAINARCTPTSMETAQTINNVLGIPLFTPDDGRLLWDIPAQETAQRLGIPTESCTSFESSFRSYQPPPKGTLLTAPYHLYGTATNTLGFSCRINRAPRGLEECLDRLFGQSSGTMVRAMAFNKIEKARYWSWPEQQTFFVLVSGYNGADSLRILPREALNYRDLCRKAVEQARSDFPRRIKRDSMNGDVTLELPVVDTGDKECYEAAVLCRILKYYGQEADLDFFEFRTAQDHEEIAGTLLRNAGIDWHRRSLGITVGNVKQCIERGQPLFVPIIATEEMDRRVADRIRNRKNIVEWTRWKSDFLKKPISVDSSADWNKWRDGLAAMRAYQVKGVKYYRYANIIGYNERSREIAYTLPSTNSEPILWLTEEEMRAITTESASY